MLGTQPNEADKSGEDGYVSAVFAGDLKGEAVSKPKCSAAAGSTQGIRRCKLNDGHDGPHEFAHKTPSKPSAMEVALADFLVPMQIEPLTIGDTFRAGWTAAMAEAVGRIDANRRAYCSCVRDDCDVCEMATALAAAIKERGE